MKLSVVMPVYNEAKTVREIVRQVRDAAFGFARGSAEPRPIRHQIPDAEVPLNARIMVALQA